MKSESIARSLLPLCPRLALARPFEHKVCVFHMLRHAVCCQKEASSRPGVEPKMKALVAYPAISDGGTGLRKHSDSYCRLLWLAEKAVRRAQDAFPRSSFQHHFARAIKLIDAALAMRERNRRAAKRSVTMALCPLEGDTVAPLEAKTPRGLSAFRMSSPTSTSPQNKRWPPVAGLVHRLQGEDVGDKNDC